jgi:hypothetical protein
VEKIQPARKRHQRARPPQAHHIRAFT